ncbi:MAG: ABC-F family ATP-binding cassette domain-containing protein, partial [Bacteroidia bacterium]
NYLQVDRLSKSYGERVLFSSINFGLQQGQKTALIAKNGAGKSTLLRIVAGRDVADSGDVVFRNDISVAFLDQDPAYEPEKTIQETVFSWNDPRMDAIRKYELLLEQNADGAVLEQAIRKVEDLKAWDIEARVKEILGRLNIHNLAQKMGTLSGGQRKRVALAALLVREPDLLILDEPTNHLDIDMIEWLESWLRRSNVSILMVTHDRYFLDQVCTDILELDRESIQRYKGNYAYYLEKKEAARQAFNSEVEKARNTFTRELEWMRRMPKARGTKAKARIDQFYEIKDKASQRLKDDQIQLSVKMNRLGGKILELVKVSKRYGETVLIEPFTYTFKRGEKIGIVGKNGCGKSTLLKMITGDLESDSGKITTGETVVFGYYAQDGIKLSPDKRVIEVIKDVADVIPLADGRNLTASQLLNLFLFPPPMQYTPVEKLSGGEKRRLYLLTVLMKNPNFLILDEPTNDLDIQTLNILQEFLESYTGCVLIVSHDRYFMDTLADHLFIFEGNGIIRDYNGNYTDYRSELSEKEKSSTQAPKQVPEMVVEKSKSNVKPSFKEVHEFNQLDAEIPKLEEKLQQLTHELNSGISDHVELNRLGEELKTLNEMLEEKTMRWLELSEKIHP